MDDCPETDTPALPENWVSEDVRNYNENIGFTEDAVDSEGSKSPEASPAPSASWLDLGFDVDTSIEGPVWGRVPLGVCIFAASTPEATNALGPLCQPITTSSPFTFTMNESVHYGYRLAEGLVLPDDLALPEGVTLHGAGGLLLLPETPPSAELPIIGPDELALLPLAELDPLIQNNPLAPYSLRGQAEEFERSAVKAKHLLGELCLTGQATVLYAPPNAGKTLITYMLIINADDSSEGFATKMRLMDDMGCHTIAPGHRGFEPHMLPKLLTTMATDKKAKGALIVVDTIKKVASLMDKNKSSAFTSACRAAVMAGATIVGFAHTNKQRTGAGKLQYGGTSDLRDDFDAAYIMGPLEEDGFEGEKVVQFECIKSRGNNAQLATYAYANAPNLSYAERLASVRLVHDNELMGQRRVEEARADADVIAAIETCIRDGDYAKMALAKAAAKVAGISERAAIRMIEKYTGSDPAAAKWCFERRNRGAMIYTLLPQPEDQTPSES